MILVNFSKIITFFIIFFFVLKVQTMEIKIGLFFFFFFHKHIRLVDYLKTLFKLIKSLKQQYYLSRIINFDLETFEL